jgi:hypothetical protein
MKNDDDIAVDMTMVGPSLERCNDDIEGDDVDDFRHQLHGFAYLSF